MALATYSDLKSSVADWLYGRTDVAAITVDSIALAESNINNGVRDPVTGETVKLRTRDMETTTTLTPASDGSAMLPTDYLEFRQVTSLDTPRRNLSLITPSYSEERYGYRESELPNAFTIIGSYLYVLPVSTTDIDLTYYAKVASLSDSATTNWLLTKAPNIYLDGALYHASRWLRNNPEDTTAFLASFISGIKALNDTDKDGRWSRGPSLTSGQRP